MKDRQGLYVGLAITLYRRPKYTAQLFEKLKECYNIDKCDIHISCDWSIEHSNNCDIVFSMAEQFAEWCDDNDISCTVYQSKPRLGIDLNKLFVIPKVFEAGNDLVIFLEDDVHPAKDALNYFVTVCNGYAWDESVIAVCGYNRTLERDKFNDDVENRLYSTWSSRGFCPWGWAMSKAKYERWFGDGGIAYKEATGEEANGRFDWFLYHKQLKTINPVVARTQSVGAFDGEHTLLGDPPGSWHKNNEYNEFGAWTEGIELKNSDMWRWNNGKSDLWRWNDGKSDLVKE